jgi:hypothetical protein
VSGTGEIQRNLLAVDFLLEPGRIVQADRREIVLFSNPHFLEQEILEPVCGDNSLPGIIGKVVRNLRAQQSQTIPEFR